MVVALLIIALAMIAGGLAAVLQGWDIVLLEHGWTLVVAGSVFTSGGAILLGLAATVFRLGHLRRELVTIRDRWGRAEFERIAPPPIDPVAAIAAGGLAATGLTAPSTQEHEADQSDEPKEEEEGSSPDHQPNLPLFLSERGRSAESVLAATLPSVGEREQTDRDESGTRLNLPDDLLGPVRREDERGSPDLAKETATKEAGWVAVHDAGRADDLTRVESELAGTPSPPAGPADEETTSGTSGSGEPPSEERISPVIGTYTSGDNRYVMFADGSIEADTPHGTFRFGSLDELKSFIASGGEPPSESA
ncbi:hypothetical protein [Microvirga massiliensis]|uniref:hypothetical protein n=1 Tax=Microvirga massiliensis TaxID=1033741 RepID=UPI00062B78BD|nr:hypothetical protein [Microvirga massiliensis]